MASIETAQDQELQLDQIISDDKVNNITFDSVNTEWDPITEKEKHEYEGLNIRFDKLMIRAKASILSESDKKYFEQNGMSYIYIDTVSPFAGNSLAIYSKSNEYKPLWLRKNDATNEKRPDIFLNDLLRWGRDKKQLSVEQYKGILDKIANIMKVQEQYLFEKHQEIKEEKDNEIDNIINNL